MLDSVCFHLFGKEDQLVLLFSKSVVKRANAWYL